MCTRPALAVLFFLSLGAVPGAQSPSASLSTTAAAEVTGGRLEVWSNVGLGIEVELTVPAAMACATADRGRARRFSWRMNRRGDRRFES